MSTRFDIDSKESDIILGWENGQNYFEVIANKNDQSYKMSRQIDEKNRVTPILATNGTLAVEWERTIGDENIIKTIVKADDSIDVEWKDHKWTAKIGAPLDGSGIENVSIKVKREVAF